jgi:hypothetical protein
LPAAELKGIGYSYRIYTLATQPQLNGIWHRGHDQKDSLLAPTLKQFPVELQDKLKTVRQRCESQTHQEEMDCEAINGPIDLKDAFICIGGKRWSALELLKLVADKLATKDETGRE